MQIIKKNISSIVIIISMVTLAFSIITLIKKGIYNQVPELWNSQLISYGISGVITSFLALIASFFYSHTFVLWIFVTLLGGYFIDFYTVLSTEVLFFSFYSLGHLIASLIRREHSFAFFEKFSLGLSLIISIMYVRVYFKMNQNLITCLLVLLPCLIFLTVNKKIFSSIPGLKRKSKLCFNMDTLSLFFTFFAIYLFLIAASIPDIGWDSQAFHLTVPRFIQENGFWHFDFKRMTTSLMSLGGNLFFTLSYSLSGEEGMRLSQVFLILLIFLLSKKHLLSEGYQNTTTAAALAISMPVLFLESRSLFIDIIWTYFVVHSVLLYMNYKKTKDSDKLILSVLFAFTSLSIKTHSAILIGILLIDYFAYSPKTFIADFIKFIPLSLVGVSPYLYNYIVSKNPVFPFMNNYFKSPYFSEQNFTNPLFIIPINFNTLYDITFNSSRYLESQNGSAGIFLFVFTIPTIVYALAKRKNTNLILVTLSLFVITFLQQAYLRYLLPAMILWAIASAPLFNLTTKKKSAITCTIALIVISINITLFPASTWYRDWTYLQAQKENLYLQNHAPERLLSRELYKNEPNSRVLYWDLTYWSDFPGVTFSNTWYNNIFADGLYQAIRKEKSNSISNYLNTFSITHIIYREENLIEEPAFKKFVEDNCKLHRTIGNATSCKPNYSTPI